MSPPAAVPGNDWTLLDVPAVEEARLEAMVSVVIEGPDPGGGAALTVEALAALGHPPERVQVIRPGEDREPTGEIVLLLAAGVIPATGLLEAHARWHGAVDDAVTLGPAPGGAPGDDPFDLVNDLTRRLTDPEHGLFLGAALGTLAVRLETLLTVGGLATGDEAAGPLGRLDLALRLACHGAVFVPEPAARASSADGRDRVELGREIASAAVEQRTLELDHPLIASLVPLPPLRPTASPHRFRRPAIVVNVDAGAESGADVLATIGPILGGRMGDLELRVQVADDHPDRPDIEAAVADDTRATIGPASTGELCASPFQLTVPALTTPDTRTIADLHRLLVDEGAGALHVTVPGAAPAEAMIEAVATGALARSRRVAEASGEPAEAVMGRLFGERWLSGVEVSVRKHGVDEPHVTEHGPLAAATDLDHERIQHLRFRTRADDLEEQAAAQSAKVLSERLRARRERLRVEGLELKLHRVRGEDANGE